MLHLVDANNPRRSVTPLVSSEAGSHHASLLDAYLNSHRARGHATSTIAKYEGFLKGWFRQFGTEENPLYTWQAMEPVLGRERIREYSQMLVEMGLTTHTIRGNLLMLLQYFSFVLDHPYVKSEGQARRIDELYGEIRQPISEFELPNHSGDAEQALPFDPERLYEFLSLLHKHSMPSGRLTLTALVKGRNYTMAVLAAETGLRIDELTHLHYDDLFFESSRIQTRFAKGSRGTGKRSRATLFPPLSRITARHYLENYRPRFPGAKKSSLLFLSYRGCELGRSQPSRIMHGFIKIATDHGFPIYSNMSWHWFRRIFATRFIERFPDKMPALLELLGHRNFATVHRYIKHSEGWMDKEIQAIFGKVETWQSDGI